MTAGRSLKRVWLQFGPELERKQNPQFLYLTYSVPMCKEGEREARKHPCVDLAVRSSEL